MPGRSSNEVARVVKPGSHEDCLTFGQLCEIIGKQIIAANPNHTVHRVDIYRAIEVSGRTYHVRVKFTVPFLSIVPESNHERSA